MRSRQPLLSLFVLFVLPALQAQTVTTGDPNSKAIRAVGQELKCQCEAHCSYTVSGCNMTGCSFRAAVTMEIRKYIDAGLSTGEIVERMIAKFGSELRNSPRAEGFGLFGWAMPFAALAAGLVIAPFVVKRLKARQAAVATPSPVDPAILSQYEQQIEEDLKDLD